MGLENDHTINSFSGNSSAGQQTVNFNTSLFNNITLIGPIKKEDAGRIAERTPELVNRALEMALEERSLRNRQRTSENVAQNSTNTSSQYGLPNAFPTPSLSNGMEQMNANIGNVAQLGEGGNFPDSLVSQQQTPATSGYTSENFTSSEHIEANNETGHMHHNKTGQTMEEVEVHNTELAVEEVVQEETFTHHIGYKDTLGKIAQKYGTTVEELVQLNNLKSEDFIRVGDALQVPLSTLPEGVNIPTAPKERKPDMEGGHYMVGKGERLSDIVNKFNIDLDDLIKWNNFDPRSLDLYEGEGLYLSDPTVDYGLQPGTESKQLYENWYQSGKWFQHSETGEVYWSRYDLEANTANKNLGNGLLDGSKGNWQLLGDGNMFGQNPYDIISPKAIGIAEAHLNIFSFGEDSREFMKSQGYDWMPTQMLEEETTSRTIPINYQGNWVSNVHTTRNQVVTQGQYMKNDGLVERITRQNIDSWYPFNTPFVEKTIWKLNVTYKEKDIGDALLKGLGKTAEVIPVLPYPNYGEAGAVSAPGTTTTNRYNWDTYPENGILHDDKYKDL
jgi:LysM repeat protein